MEEFSLGKTLTLAKWQPVCREHPFSPESLSETLLGGQAFRWFTYANKTWIGIWNASVVALRLTANAGLEANILTAHLSIEDIQRYLGLQRHGDWISLLPINSDPIVASLYHNWSGLVVLDQPFEEALLAFICSSNKQIPHIRAILEALALSFGPAIPGTPFHALPSWEVLARTEESALRQCGLGYRAPYIRDCGRFLCDNANFTDSLKRLPTADARAQLMRLPGVGPKVADCVLLFGLGRPDAFPVDTWIDKILRYSYPDLGNWNRRDLATFARIHFGPAGGLAQQWFFAQARKNGTRHIGSTSNGTFRS
jgi:N-glycosylase/DNA lyase